MKLVIDDRYENKNNDVVLDCCSSEQAIDALYKMDGRQHTLLVLERNDGWQLCIGGGGREFVVTLSSRSDENFTLLNPNEGGEELVELCAGGQFAEFPREIVVDRELVGTVIHKFFNKEEGFLNWMLD
ncbi:hypothetical protein [Pseudomonas sp. Marseille-Q8238]